MLSINEENGVYNAYFEFNIVVVIRKHVGTLVSDFLFLYVTWSNLLWMNLFDISLAKNEYYQSFYSDTRFAYKLWNYNKK